MRRRMIASFSLYFSRSRRSSTSSRSFFPTSIRSPSTWAARSASVRCILRRTFSASSFVSFSFFSRTMSVRDLTSPSVASSFSPSADARTLEFRRSVLILWMSATGSALIISLSRKRCRSACLPVRLVDEHLPRHQVDPVGRPRPARVVDDVQVLPVGSRLVDRVQAVPLRRQVVEWEAGLDQPEIEVGLLRHDRARLRLPWRIEEAPDGSRGDHDADIEVREAADPGHDVLEVVELGVLDELLGPVDEDPPLVEGREAAGVELLEDVRGCRVDDRIEVDPRDGVVADQQSADAELLPVRVPLRELPLLQDDELRADPVGIGPDRRDRDVGDPPVVGAEDPRDDRVTWRHFDPPTERVVTVMRETRIPDLSANRTKASFTFGPQPGRIATRVQSTLAEKRSFPSIWTTRPDFRTMRTTVRDLPGASCFPGAEATFRCPPSPSGERRPVYAPRSVSRWTIPTPAGVWKPRPTLSSPSVRSRTTVRLYSSAPGAYGIWRRAEPSG